MDLYIYWLLFKIQETRASTGPINRYGDFQVKNQRLCAVICLTGNQAVQKAVSQVTDTRGYLILGCGIAQQIGYIQFPSITSPKLTQPP